MQYRRLGSSRLLVSEVGLGCNNFGMAVGPAEGASVVGAALDAGINFFDTADIYGNTESEVILGKALGVRRSKVIVATKFGMAIQGDERAGGGGRRWIMTAVEDSLRRLDTDYIDLYQMHQPDPATPIDETLRALDLLVTQGKVRQVGCSNFPATLIEDACRFSAQAGVTAFVSSQFEYSLLARAAERELVPACKRLGLGILPYFPLASGLLTGKYRRGEPAPPGSRIAAWGAAGVQALNSERFAVVERLSVWANGRGRSILELAFSWLLANAQIASVIAGATSPEQVLANVAAARWVLSPSDQNEVASILQGMPVPN